MKKLQRGAIVSVVTIAAAFCGMFGPIAFGTGHRNAFWEPVFGVGYFVAGFIFHPYVLNRAIWIVGDLIWPLATIAAVGCLVWKITSGPRHVQAWWAGFYILSLSCWVSAATANFLTAHWLPFFFNYQSVNF